MTSTPPQYLGAIDQGTTSTRFILFNRKGELVTSHQVPLPNIFPQAGWQEQDPLIIFDTVQQCLQGVLTQGYTIDQIASIGITNQRETTVIWNRITGKPYYNAIVWCDTRTEGLVSEIIQQAEIKNPDGTIQQHGQDCYRAQTGLPISTYFSALKIKWLLQNVPEFANDIINTPNEVCIGTVDTWLLYCLTGEFKTDISNASRTLLFNINTLQWDINICEKFGLKTPLINLPPITHNCDYFGTIKNTLPYGGIKINGILGDQQASLLGFGCLRFGEVKNTYGTGCFLLMNTGGNIIPSKNGLLTTIGFQLGENNILLKSSKLNITSDVIGNACYALEGSVASCGSLLSWLIESMKIADSPQTICDYALEVNDNAGLVIIPAFTGLLAPYWCLDARGLIIGLTRYSTNKHLCRAVLESIAMQTRDVVEAMKHDVIENRKLLTPNIVEDLQLHEDDIITTTTTIASIEKKITTVETINNDTTTTTILATETTSNVIQINDDHCQDVYAYDNIIKSLRVDGGVTKSNLLCSFQSDVLNIPVLRAIMQERTALGAAIASGLGCGFFTSIDQVQEEVWGGSCDANCTGNEYKELDCPDIYKPDDQLDGFFRYIPNSDKRNVNLGSFVKKWNIAIEKSKGWASIE